MTKYIPATEVVFKVYENNISQRIVLTQYAKNAFSSLFDNERHNFEEIEINGCYGLYIDYKDSYRDSEHIASSVVWDNGDYILQMDSNLSKDVIAPPIKCFFFAVG